LSYQAKNKGPIFIVGAPRSGTTLLQYILRSHPRLSLPTGESQFMIPLYRNASSFGDLSRKENVRRPLQEMYRRSANFLDTDLHGMRFEIDSLAAELHAQGCNTIPKIIAGLFEKNARGEGKERWGDKTPYYILHLRTIIEMFPDAQIIHIIRDGRDCALSMFKRKFDLNVYNTYNAAGLWQQFVETGQKVGRELGPEKYFEFRYEDLLMDQVSIMKRICNFLDEDYSESLINFKTSSEHGKTPLLQKRVQKDNAEKWRKLMTSWQIRVFESAAGDTLVHNGYSLTTAAKPLPLLLRASFHMHNKMLTWYNKKFINKRR
jgi:hypothetical protein